MAGRRYRDSDVSVDKYEDRRDYAPRGGRGGRYDEVDRYEEIDYRRVQPAPAVREREREKPRRSEAPAFLQEDYGRTTAGPVVLRAREREDFEFVPRPRRRSPSPEPEPKVSREEIIIRRDESEHRAPPPPRPRERDYDREEIIIRRDEREPERRAPPPPRDRGGDREEIIIRRDERERDIRPPPREPERDREEIIIRRDQRERDVRPPPREVERERDEVIIRRDEGGRQSRFEADFERDDVVSRRGGHRDPMPGSFDHEEIIIRRDEHVEDDRRSRYTSRRDKSHERARSRGRGGSDTDGEEIIIRRDERSGRNGDRDRQEIIIRRNSVSRSPSPAPTAITSFAQAPAPVINAPAIHQEVITHHRHIDHGYELALAPIRSPRPVTRPPSPPSPPPPPPRERSEERIEIHQSGVRNGRAYHEDIIIDSRENERVPARPPPRDPYYDTPPRREPPRPAPAPVAAPYRERGYERDRDLQEEADYYNARAMQRAYIGEGHNGAVQDWAIVDVPPGTDRVRMHGAGGGEQEITWQRYNGVRRSKFYADGASDEGYGSEVARPAPAAEPLPTAGEAEIGRRYGRPRDPTQGLWTEITKDLVVKEAIQELGYEYEETDDFYYIIAYLRYVSPHMFNNPQNFRPANAQNRKT